LTKTINSADDSKGGDVQFEYRSKLFDIDDASKEDHIYKVIAKSKNFYEIDLLEYIFQIKDYICNKKNNVAIDVGANIGNHSLFIRSFISEKIISIEPNQEILPVLRQNLNKNINNFTIFENAIGSTDGKGSIILPVGHEGNIGAAKIVADNDGGKINITSLDSLFRSWKVNNKKSTVCLIKIDVEGMEFDVLSGAKDILKEDRPHIFLEAMTHTEYKKIYKFLKPLGYKRLPGHKAVTPVYHFAYKPSLGLLAKTNYMHFKNLYWKACRYISKNK
jgi:FkbM family methyltransferase